MTTFRYKTNKYVKDKNNITTLDIEHKKRETNFINKKNTISSKKLKLERMNEELNKLENNNIYTDDIIKKKANIKDSIESLEREIYTINNNINEIDYYYKTYDILLDYYNEDKEDKNLESNNILNFFSDKKSNSNDKNKSSLLNDYKILVDDTYTNKKNMDNIIKICNNCNIEKIINNTDGVYECHNCGHTEILIMEQDKSTYNTVMPDISTYAYKRINHQQFRWLTASLLVLCSIGAKIKGAMLHLII
jgi:predicted RNA-binding Zn-ribbon protein involved in translation (DUF1610 family)